MRAESFTGYGALKLVEIPKPISADGRVRVRITAAGVTPLDHTILSGGYARATAPLVLGNEGAGVVEDPGDSSFTVGARVMFAGPYGVFEDGTYSEWIAVHGEDAVAMTAERFGKLDVVFANAGVGGASPLGQTSLATFEQIIRTNLTAAFFTVQAALPQLNDRASIILNGSVHAVLGMPGWTAYAAAKGGVRSMTRNLASELAPRGIRVNQVTPGGTRTPIWSKLAPTDDAMAAMERRIARSVPLGRLGEADEVAKAALYLASDDASNVTGAEIVIDGSVTGAPSGAPIYRTA